MGARAPAFLTPGQNSTRSQAALRFFPAAPLSSPKGMASITFSTHGAHIQVCVDAPDLLDQVRELLPPGAVETDDFIADACYRVARDEQRLGTDAFAVYLNERCMVRRASLDRALLIMSNSLHWGVAAHARSVLFVHAGVVAWNGGALMLPGSSRYGKSTLVDALVRLGAGYYTDECATLDDDGRVHPYRKPIWLRRDHPRHAAPAFARRRQSVPADEALPVGLILFTRFRPNAEWAPVPISCGQALLGLAANTMVAGVQPERTMSILTKLVERAPAYASERGEAGVTAERILCLLESCSPDVSAAAPLFNEFTEGGV